MLVFEAFAFFSVRRFDEAAEGVGKALFMSKEGRIMFFHYSNTVKIGCFCVFSGLSNVRKTRFLYHNNAAVACDTERACLCNCCKFCELEYTSRQNFTFLLFGVACLVLKKVDSL